MSGAEAFCHCLFLPLYIVATALNLALKIACLPIDVPIYVVNAIMFHFKYSKPQEEFGQHLIESLKLLKERYQLINALHQTHSDVCFVIKECRRKMFNNLSKNFSKLIFNTY